MALLHHFLPLPMLLLVKTLFLISSFWQICTATDTLKQGKWMNGSDAIVSESGIFELGFFSPGESKNLYLGIWYKKISIQNPAVVWVANRENPISKNLSSSSFLSINLEGNLLISDGKGTFYSLTSLPPSPKNTSATLLDSGNLILRDSNDTVVWESFDHPSDTLLPGMKLGFNSITKKTWSFTSWTSLEDPSPGNFSILLDSSMQFFIMKGGSQRYWTTGRWNGQMLSFVPEMRLSRIYNFSFISDQKGTYLTYSQYNKSWISRLVMDLSGQFKMLSWMDNAELWNLFWVQPRRQCQVYAFCGAFSSCNERMLPFCQCLQGFEPYKSGNWSRKDPSTGCVRRISLQCGDEDQFVLMSNVKFPVNSESLASVNAQECKLLCLTNCSCSAYAYTNHSECFMWK